MSNIEFGPLLDGLDTLAPSDGETITRGPLGVFCSTSLSRAAVLDDAERSLEPAPENHSHIATEDAEADAALASMTGFWFNHDDEISHFELLDENIPPDAPLADWQISRHDALNVQKHNTITISEGAISLPPLMPVPDDRFPMVPPNVKYLLDHFTDRFIGVVSFTPWELLHIPRVMETLGELTIWKTPTHFRAALFYAVLAVSAYHIDRSTSSRETAGHWWRVGTSHYQRAVLELGKGWEEQQGPLQKAAYKDVLTTLLTMVTVCITSGRLDEARSYLLQAERTVHRHGLLASEKSHKVRILYGIFVFLRIIEESMFAYPLSNQITHVDRGTVLIEGYDSSISIQYAETPREDQQLAQHSLWDQPPEAVPADYSYPPLSSAYGLPGSLLVLLAQVSRLVQQKRLRKAGCLTDDLFSTYELDGEVQTVEEALCTWKSNGSYQQRALSPVWTPQTTVIDQTLTSFAPQCDPEVVAVSVINPTNHPGDRNTPTNHNMSYAFHSALLIYFYRQVREISPYLLQPLVREVKQHLLADEEMSSVSYETTSSNLAWPGFIAAVEAEDEGDFTALTSYLQRCGDRHGLRNHDQAASLAAEVRNSRLKSRCIRQDPWMGTGMFEEGQMFFASG